MSLINILEDYDWFAQRDVGVFYSTSNHISPVISLCTLMFKFPLTIYHIISM